MRRVLSGSHLHDMASQPSSTQLIVASTPAAGSFVEPGTSAGAGAGTSAGTQLQLPALGSSESSGAAEPGSVGSIGRGDGGVGGGGDNGGVGGVGGVHRDTAGSVGSARALAGESGGGEADGATLGDESPALPHPRFVGVGVGVGGRARALSHGDRHEYARQVEQIKASRQAATEERRKHVSIMDDVYSRVWLSGFRGLDEHVDDEDDVEGPDDGDESESDDDDGGEAGADGDAGGSRADYAAGGAMVSAGGLDGGEDSSKPLLGGKRAPSRHGHGHVHDEHGPRRRRLSSAVPSGDPGTFRTVLVILKSFVGSAVLFLPSAFVEGGWLFSSITLCLMAFLSTKATLLVIECRTVYGGSFGDLGDMAVGKWGGNAVKIAICLSQMGFCCSYCLFISENVHGLLIHFGGCEYANVKQWMLIMMQLPLYIPLTWVRRIRYFAYTNLLADFCILFGIGAILAYCIYANTLGAGGATGGTAPGGAQPMTWLNPGHWPLFLGTSVYAFEGVGLVVPIHQSLSREGREEFPKVFSRTIMAITICFVAFAVTCYSAIGDTVQPVITLDMPTGVWWVVAIQAGYCVALACTFPLMLYPCISFIEKALTPSVFHAGKPSLERKWKKNFGRALLVLAVAGAATAAASELGNLVSLIGAACCVPLAYIFPGLFHYKLISGPGAVADGPLAAGKGRSRACERAWDVFFVVFGLSVMVFATGVAVYTWAPEASSGRQCPGG